jgi:hypothetical protein
MPAPLSTTAPAVAADQLAVHRLKNVRVMV